MSYEVRLPDQIENTGLDCQFFATREEAVRAAEVVAAACDLPGEAEEYVSPAKDEPTLTFGRWNERGW